MSTESRDLLPLIPRDDVSKLLAYSIEFPTKDKLNGLSVEYRNNDKLFLIGALNNDDLEALIGLEKTGDSTYLIKHLSVDSLRRLKGLGKSIVLHAISKFRISTLLAETDIGAKGIYLALGLDLEKTTTPKRCRGTLLIEDTSV